MGEFCGGLNFATGAEGRSNAAPLQKHKGKRQIIRLLGDFRGSGGEFELELLGAEIGVSGGKFYGAGLFFGANPDGAGAADQGEGVVADDFGGGLRGGICWVGWGGGGGGGTCGGGGGGSEGGAARGRWRGCGVADEGI